MLFQNDRIIANPIPVENREPETPGKVAAILYDPGWVPRGKAVKRTKHDNPPGSGFRPGKKL